MEHSVTFPIPDSPLLKAAKPLLDAIRATNAACGWRIGKTTMEGGQRLQEILFGDPDEGILAKLLYGCWPAGRLERWRAKSDAARIKREQAVGLRLS